jgi:hypothetical protein
MTSSSVTLPGVKLITDPVSGALFVEGLLYSAIPYGADYVELDSSGITSDVYSYKAGGSGGTLIKTVTVTYTDSGKTAIFSIAES